MIVKYFSNLPVIRWRKNIGWKKTDLTEMNFIWKIHANTSPDIFQESFDH